MQLFKRALLSLFPNEIANQNINPASMFVSFISAKEFFSVINRKIVENYKLNLFDIALDPFEFKTGFGENPQIKQKDNDLYYGYCGTANLNGYRFLNCANISNSITLVTSIYTKDIFTKYDQDAYLNFLYTVYLLGFLFLSRIKIFPHQNKEENYNRCIEVFFHFYEFVCSQTGKKITKEQINQIKKDLLNEIDIFFLLFIVYQKLNITFTNPEMNDKDLYSWIFYDELKGDQKNIINEFIDNYDTYTTHTNISAVEAKIMQFILPADILIRYLFLDMDMFLVTESVITKIYDKKILDKYIKTFRKDESKLEEFLLHITDYRHFKKNFFSGVQKYLITVLRNEMKGDIDDELDDLMSSIGDDFTNLDNFKIPERIKKESKIMEKILNFYITFIGGFWISRGDNFFMRLFRKPLIDKLSQHAEMFDQKNHYSPAKEDLYYYGSLLYNYGKNVFYYKYASENVRAGKQRFFLPYKSTLKNIYSNIGILKLFDENFITTILQDINPKDIRMFVQSKKVLDMFKKKFGKEISTIVQKSEEDITKEIYGGLGSLLQNTQTFLHTIEENLSKEDIYHIKENIYSIDFWISQVMYQACITHKIPLKKHYSDLVIIGIFANLRESLLGLFLYITFLSSEQIAQRKDLKIQILKKIYLTDILNININDPDRQNIVTALDATHKQFEEILQHRIAIDDNKDFLKISMENWLKFIEGKSEDDIYKKISGEDIIWFRGFLKNITYYNKRFLIPK